MNTKIYVPIVIVVALVFFGAVAFAGGMGGMGGGNSGMMGGGHGMMGGPMMSNPWQEQPGNQYPSYQKQTETEKLREEIRRKRHELSDLYRSENPDKDQIDQKIEELNNLEAELDKRLSGN